MRVLKWSARLLAVAAGALALGSWLIGSTVPQEHRAARTACFAAPRAVVWEAVTIVENQPDWRSGLTAVEDVPGSDVRAWREIGSWGEVTMEEVSATPEERFVGRIEPGRSDFGGTWTYELEDCPTGTRLTITEDGEIYNPLFRLLTRFVWGYHATQEQYLRDLGQHLGVEVMVERVE